MKTINQSVEIPFNAVDVRDVITILPIMDRLVREINETKEQVKKDEEKLANYEKAYYYEENKHDLDYLMKQYKVLSNLGFISQFDIKD